MTAVLNSAQSQVMIGQRRARSLASARQRTRFVAALRVILVSLGCAVSLNAIMQIVSSGGPVEDEADLTPAGNSERIINPRFTGRDESGVPYVITAEAAERRSGSEAGITDLEHPALDYAMLDSGGDTSRVLAERGTFHETELSLHLRDHVRLTTRSGYVFDTSEATLYLQDGIVIGNAPVSGDAPWGAVRADRFELREDAQQLILSGDVRTRFETTPSPASEPNRTDAEPSEETIP